MPEEEVLAPVKNYGYQEGGEDDFITEFEEPENKPEEKPAEKPAEKPEEKKPEVEDKKPEPEEKKPESKPEEKPADTKPEEKAEEKPAEVTASDWRKAINAGVDKYEVLAELGYDKWTIDMIKYKDQTGDVVPYLKAKTVDYSKMTPEQLLKEDMQRSSPGMSEKALNFKFTKEFSDKYYLNREDYPEGSDEAEYGQEQLRLDAEKKRKEFIEEQQKFTAPEPQPDLDATKKEAALQQQRAQIGNAVMNNDATKNLQATKSIVFGEGKESFNYPIADIQPLIDSALNTIVNSGRTDLTGVDMDHFYKTLAYGADPAKFEKEFAIHLKAVAKKQLEEELGNVTPKEEKSDAPPDPSKDWGYKTK
jgi:hypothetical protein